MFRIIVEVTNMPEEELPDIDPILNAIRRIHPGHQAKLAPYIDKLAGILDSFLAQHKNMSQNMLLKFAGLLEKINETSYYVYNELRKKTKYPSIFDRALSALRWSKINRRLGGKLPHMK